MSGFSLAWIVIGLPLVGFLFQTLVGGWVMRGKARGVARYVLALAAIAPIALAFLLGLGLYRDLAALAEGARAVVVGGPAWISVAGLEIPFELRVDPLSVTMVLVITGIGGLIHLYSTGYMADERDYSRFFAYLNLFVAAMLLLVLANNLALLFVGWEGVGLCSYLLIGFWHEDRENVRAANKAFIVNRVGDWGLLLGMFLIVAVQMANGAGGRLLSYDAMLPALDGILRASPAIALPIALLLFIGAAGKSAQFPLHIWLPDAMAGPTPVSALIHAATMVTSGVFLLTRMSLVLAASPAAGAVVAAVGAFTALYAAAVALGQTDIKKVLAWSTVSQLGFMFIAVGAGAPWAGMFHVVTHAFFKALLFLGAGAVIHAMAHEQDMRRYGRLARYLPVTALTMGIGTLAIAGFPFLSGYFSKDAILLAAYGTADAFIGEIPVARIAAWVGLFAALLTAFYMARLMMLTFFGDRERWREPSHEAHGVEGHGLETDHRPREVGFAMLLPLILLAGLSAVGGFIMERGETFRRFLEGVEPVPLPNASSSVPIPTIAAAAAVVGLLAGIVAYRRGLPPSEGDDDRRWSRWRLAARENFGFDRGVTDLALGGGGDLARALEGPVDARLVGGGYGGGVAFVGLVGRGLKALQSGFVRTYAAVMLVGVAAILLYVFGIGRGGWR